MQLSRLQRWALFLAGYSYNIKFKPTAEHANADCLSRLPMGPDLKFENEGSFHETICIVQQEQINKIPVMAKTLRQATQDDTVLSTIRRAIHSGQINRLEGAAYEAFRRRGSALTEQDGILLWGTRVVVPTTLQKQLLSELHKAHTGVTRMKALARSYVWWPSIDTDIEQITSRCDICLLEAKQPTKAPLHHWEQTQLPWQRIHIDFCGPFLGKMWLVAVDSYSKWPEVIPMGETTTKATITRLRQMFSRFGLPNQLVSDNGPQFTPNEFANFCTQNGIAHIKSAPYHPASNGLAERFVQTFKRAASKMKHSTKDLDYNVQTLLFSYRTTPQSTTNISPAELMFGRKLKTRLDLCRPGVQQRIRLKQLQESPPKRQPREFNEGDRILARNYGQQGRWEPGIVLTRLGPVTYRVQVRQNIIWKRHVNQLQRDGRQMTKEPSPNSGLEDGVAPTMEQPNIDNEQPQERPASPPAPAAALRRGTRLRRPPNKYSP